MDSENYYSNEPVDSWGPTDLDKLLLWGVEKEMSDLSILPGKPVYLEIHGEWYTVTKRPVRTSEIATILDCWYGGQGSAMVQSGQDLDFSHEIKKDRLTRLRFRCNATACADGYATGINLVLRSIPGTPPALESLNLEPEILSAIFPTNGLVLITGVVGSGKSTTLAAILRKISETQRRHILTYEAPIEFDLANNPNAIGPIAQCEIGRHLPSFDVASRNSARRAGNVILLGEARDKETLTEVLKSAEKGVCVYSTVHTMSVADTPMRMVNDFPPNEQNGIASALWASLRLIIHQRLVPGRTGGRVALREFLVFQPKHCNRLYGTPLSKVTPVIQEMVTDDGQTLLADARRKYTDGAITDEAYRSIVKEFDEVMHG